MHHSMQMRSIRSDEMVQMKTHRKRTVRDRHNTCLRREKGTKRRKNDMAALEAAAQRPRRYRYVIHFADVTAFLSGPLVLARSNVCSGTRPRNSGMAGLVPAARSARRHICSPFRRQSGPLARSATGSGPIKPDIACFSNRNLGSVYNKAPAATCAPTCLIFKLKVSIFLLILMFLKSYGPHSIIHMSHQV